MNKLTFAPKESSTSFRQLKGFTIVELLIVIVVIGILAAISIVAYNGIQNRANDTSVEMDLSNIAKKFELYYVDNSRYPINVTEMPALNVQVSKNAYFNGSQHPFNLVPCMSASGANYSLAAVSKSGKKYFVSNTSGSRPQVYTGSTAWDGTAPMCSTTLSGGTVIAGISAGSYNGSWRPWTN